MKKISISIGLAVLLLIFLSSCMKKTGNSLIHELEREPEAVSVTDSIKIFPDLVPDAGFNNTSPKYVRTLSDEECGYNEEETIKPIYPKMIESHDEKHNLNLEISETLVTMEEYKSYLVQTYSSKAEHFEGWAQEWIGGKFQKDWPVCFVSWREAADYCNWLSNENGLQSVYSYNYNDEPVIDKTSNGYRFPYTRELLILSGLTNGLSQEEYEAENTCDKNDLFPVYEGKKNRYGIYDLLGNIPQYCNDYYLRGYDYYDFENNPYGPDEYTPDNEVKAFLDGFQIVYDDTKQEPLLCAFGCYYDNASYDSVMKRVIIGTNTIGKDSPLGIRIVRNLPASE